MPLSDDLLSQLEDAYFGRLTAKEQSRLEALLEADAHLKEEAHKYQATWQAFDALKNKQQAGLFQQWEQEWLKSDEEALIEWFIAGKLHEDLNRYLQNRYETDTEFAAQVDLHRSLTEGFSALQSIMFRQKTATWEALKPAAKSRSLSSSGRRVLAIAASILLLIAASFSWWNYQQFSDESLLAKYSSLPVTGNTLGAHKQSDDYLQTFELAHQYMKDKKYAPAIAEFQQLSKQPFPANWSPDTRKYYSDNVEWSLVLTLLALQQTDAFFMQKLEKIIHAQGHDYQEKALALRADLDSFWRGIHK